jgi:hypothetical protein
MTDSRRGESGGPEGSDSEFFIEKSSGFRPLPAIVKGLGNPEKDVEKDRRQLLPFTADNRQKLPDPDGEQLADAHMKSAIEERSLLDIVDSGQLARTCAHTPDRFIAQGFAVGRYRDEDQQHGYAG